MSDLCRKLFFCCGSSRSKVDYDNVLADSEREAVADLLNYLENVIHTHRSASALQARQLRRARGGAAHSYTDLFADVEDDLQRAETDFFTGEPLNALSTLVYSQNIDLQRSASLTFAEITERGELFWYTIRTWNICSHSLLDVRPVDKATLEPILFLLESSDIEVQRAASAALGNLAVDGMETANSITLIQSC
jgi:vacuolar protein 8